MFFLHELLKSFEDTLKGIEYQNRENLLLNGKRRKTKRKKEKEKENRERNSKKLKRTKGETEEEKREGTG